MACTCHAVAVKNNKSYSTGNVTMFLRILLFLCIICSTAFANDNSDNDSNNYTQTRYPIVLVHTFLGFDNIGPLEYWYGIPRALREGGAEVFTTQVSAVNSSEVRGEQLLKQIEDILAVTGAEKINLIGHSHGGQTARYVAAIIPDRVASVTSIGSPVKGTPPADLVQTLSERPLLDTLLPGTLNGLAYTVDFVSGGNLPQDARAGLWELTTAGNEEFNLRFPDGVPATACGEGDYVANGIHLFSWAGSQDRITNWFDPTAYVFSLTKQFFDEPSNGLIGRCSSHYGQVIRDDYAMDHLDEVNQLFGLVSHAHTNPITIYRQHANRLRNLGL